MAVSAFSVLRITDMSHPAHSEDFFLIHGFYISCHDFGLAYRTFFIHFKILSNFSFISLSRSYFFVNIWRLPLFCFVGFLVNSIMVQEYSLYDITLFKIIGSQPRT